MDKATLISGMKYSRERLLGTLDGIEKSGYDMKTVLAWRPGPGRAHIGWQAIHCAATLDRYLNVGVLKQSPADPKLCEDFAGGSTPSDHNVPSLAEIREKLEKTLSIFVRFIESQSPEEMTLQRPFGKAGQTRNLEESVQLLTWHEAHHQGQIHLTWNLFKAAHPAT